MSFRFPAMVGKFVLFSLSLGVYAQAKLNYVCIAKFLLSTAKRKAIYGMENERKESSYFYSSSSFFALAT